MRYFITIQLFLVVALYSAQNNLSLSSGDGKAFRVITQGKVFNETAQANVVMEKLTKDTLQLELEFENKKRFPATLYLLEKGIPCKNKEFNYRVIFDGVNMDLSFATIYDVLPSPQALVPSRPAIDTTRKPLANILGHLCELKEGRIFYFNNIPEGGKCTSAMPGEYLSYIAQLMSRVTKEDYKFTIAENVCRNNCMSVAQLTTVLAYLPFELEKLKLIVIAYPFLVDPENKSQLENSLQFDVSKKELAEVIKNTAASKPESTAGKCQQPASQLLVENYAGKLKAFDNDTERLDAFKRGYPDLCYTNEQAMLILNTFVHDREKLEAAKLLYVYSVEKAAFFQVKQVFSYNESMSELKRFIDRQTQ